MTALGQLIAEGINVNVTLLFAREAYERAAEAYLAGLEALVARGGGPSRVASVASVFVSRIDAAIDAALDARRTLAEAGISLKDTTDALLAEGIELFAQAFRTLLAAVEQQRSH